MVKKSTKKVVVEKSPGFRSPVSGSRFMVHKVKGAKPPMKNIQRQVFKVQHKG